MSVNDNAAQGVEDLCSSIEHLNTESSYHHGQIIISDRDTPSMNRSSSTRHLLPMYDVRDTSPSRRHLQMYDVRDTSPSRMTSNRARSPTRLQAESCMAGQSAPCSTVGKTVYERSAASQSLPVSPFFNQNEIEQHGLKAREITQKLIQSLNETKGRLERQHIGPDWTQCNDNILERSVTVSSGKTIEPYNTKRRLFLEESPPSILRKSVSPRKLGPVVFETRSDNEWTDNSFNTLPQESFRSGLVNSEQECLGIFDDSVRKPDFGEHEFIHGLRDLEGMTRSNYQVQQQGQSLQLSPGAKKAMETLNYGTSSNMRPQDYGNVTSEEIREIEGVRNHLHTILQSSPTYHDTSSTNPRSTSCSRSPSRESYHDASSSTLTNVAKSTRWANLSAAQRSSTNAALWSAHSPRTGRSPVRQSPRTGRSPVRQSQSRVLSPVRHSPRRGRSPVRRWRDGTDWMAVAQKEAERTSYSDLDFDEIMQVASRATGRSGDQSSIVDPLERSTEPGQMEVRLLKDNCARERFRRQHCERIIETLRRRLADHQEQLTMSVNTERKKDIMIDQLDKTLSRVVDGWKQREAEKQSFIDKLKADSEALNKNLDNKTQMMAKFESDLQKALAELAVEQKKVVDLEKFKEEEHEKEHERLAMLMEQQQQKMKGVEKERDELDQEVEKLKKDHADLEETLLEERAGWQETTDDLKIKINNLDVDFRDCLTSEKQRADATEEALEGTKEVLDSVQQELQRCQVDLDTMTRERNTLRVEMGLLEARMESSKRKLESDLNAEFERTLSKKLGDAEENHFQTERDMRESHQKIMHELSENSQKTLGDAIQTLKENFGKREIAYKEEIKTLEERVEQSTNEIQELRLAKQRIEAQREDLVKNLKGLMDSHATPVMHELDLADNQATGYDEPDQFTPSYPHHQPPVNSQARPHVPLTDHVLNGSRDNRPDQSHHHMAMTSPGRPYGQSQFGLQQNGHNLANERQRYIEEAFRVVQSVPSSHSPSTVRYDANSDLGKQRMYPPPRARELPPRHSKYTNNNNDDISDVLSNDGHDYYPISEPVTRYATPSPLSSNHYARQQHVMETPRPQVPYAEFRTPYIVAPPVATSTELRPEQERRKQAELRAGGLPSSGYRIGHGSPTDVNHRFSVGGTGEFRPLQPSLEDTTRHLDFASSHDDHDGLSQHRQSPTRLNLESNGPVHESTSSHKEWMRHGANAHSSPPSQDSFHSLPNGTSDHDLSGRVNTRQGELQHFIQKLLNHSDPQAAVDIRKKKKVPTATLR